MKFSKFNKTFAMKILIVSLFVFHLSSFFMVKTNSFEIMDKDSAQEVLYKVNSHEEAYHLSVLYQLELIHISHSGVAKFTTTFATDLTTLLEAGFALNHYSEVARPPWQRTEDPYLKDQYALTMMQTIEAWDITLGSSAVTVAIIDTGIDINHPEFEGRISPLSFNAVTETVGISAVSDDHGHGTMVAGIIGAIKDNSRGIAGIAQNVQLMVIKANEENQGVFKDSALIEGIYYAVDNGADILNLSLGGTYANPQTEAALSYAKQQGVIVVAAAGNNGTSELFYPAAFSSTLSISAVDDERKIASFSNFGSTIDLSAPGVSIVTTVRNSGYGTVNGTSFAAPQVAGVLALMISHFGNLPIDELTTRLLLATMDEGEVGRDDYFGHGIANTYNALTFEVITVQFETFGGTDIDPLVVVEGQSFDLPDAPILSDHVFEGWFKDADFTIPWDETSDVATSGLILYAKFNASFHTVHFITDGTSVDSLVVERGTTFNLPTTTLEGFEFVGWMTDIDQTTLYEEEPLWSDLTLYAKFEAIVYYDVTLIVDNTIYNQFHMREGDLVTLETPSKIGHDFDGWYLDQDYSINYEETIIEDHLVLYGRFIPHVYTVDFVTSGSDVSSITIEHGDSFVVPETTKDGYVLIGWYLDENYTERYLSEPVTQHMTLYAKFSSDAVLVTYIVDGEFYGSEWVESGDTPLLLAPEKLGYAFDGWYIDSDLTTSYLLEPIQNDLILYAEFTILTYTITWYDYDGITVLTTLEVFAGESAVHPNTPQKPSSLHFNYTFSHWSIQPEFVYSDLDIFPIYERTFIKNSVSLNPGIDSIRQGTSWLDAGINFNDERLNVHVSQQINLNSPGLYTVTYTIYDNGNAVHTLVRKVRVTEPDMFIDIILNPSLTTLFVGGRYTERGATSSSGTIEIIGNVDMTQVGVYEIIYRVDIDGMTFERSRFVHVIEEPILNDNQLLAFVAKREDVDYVA